MWNANQTPNSINLIVCVDYIKANQEQLCSEADPFTRDRYKQFVSKIKNPKAKLEIGCNTGRGWKILRDGFPEAVFIGLDIVEERLK